MSVVAPPLHDHHSSDPVLSSPPPTSTSFNQPPPFHQSISSPVVVPFPVFHQSPSPSSSRLQASPYSHMAHAQSFSALGPRNDASPDSAAASVPPPAPKLPVQELPPASPSLPGVVPSDQLPPTPDPSPPNSKVLFTDGVVSVQSGDLTPSLPLTLAETPRRIPSAPLEPISSTSSAPPATRNRSLTHAVVPVRPPNEHRPKSMGPPRPVRKSQTMMHPTSVRMSESSSADGRHRWSSINPNPPTFADAPGFPRTMTAPPDSSSFASGDVTPSDLGNMDGLEAKVVLLGSQGVGKTSLILRYTKGTFNAAPTTIGSSLHTRKLVHSGVQVKLQIWDTAGQERFRSMAPIYYRGAHVCILVYDISDRRSFEDVRSWLDELKRTLPKETVIYIVGSKVDLRTRRAVSFAEAQRTIRTWLRPPPPPDAEINAPSNRNLFRSSSLAARSDSPSISAASTPTRSHSSSALVTLNTGVSPTLPSPVTQTRLKGSPDELPRSPRLAKSSVPFPTRGGPPALQIIPPAVASSTLPLSPRSTKISFGNLQSPSRPTSMTFTEPISPLITPASPTLHGVSAGRFSISGVLGYSRTNSTSGAVSNLARLAEDFPRSPQEPTNGLERIGARETSPGRSATPRRVRIESTPMLFQDNRRKSEDWSSRTNKPWRMGEGPGAAEALGEFGAGVRRRQSGGDLLDPDSSLKTAGTNMSSSSSMALSMSTNSRPNGGRARGGSVGRDTRLYGESGEDNGEWGTEVEGLKMGEVSALSGEGIEKLFRSISALLVDKREKIERDRTLRRKDSVMLLDSDKNGAALNGKSKSRGCCV